MNIIKAATKIQSLTRGHLERKSIKQQNNSATKIQSKFRGHLARLKLDALKKQEFLCPKKQGTIGFNDSTLTKCGHIFDRYSLSRWIDEETEIKSSVACPSCQQNIVSVNTELLLFARDGNVEAIQDVVKQGANMKISDRYGWTALHFAVVNGHTETVKILAQALIERVTNLEAKDNDGRTALQFAVINGHTETVKILAQALIERSANLERGCCTIS